MPEDVKVSLLENGKEIAQAKVQDNKAVFSHVRPGIYKIAAPLSLDNALPASQYLIVREKGSNQAVLDYPKYNTSQTAVTQRVSLRGIGNSEFAYADYNPEEKTVEFVQNSGQPHLYFTDEYAHLKIEKADGTVLLDESFIGNQNLKSKVQEFNLEYGDKIIVRHREQAARRAVVRKETNEDIKLPYKDAQTITYVLTDKGFTVNDETQADADRRYDEAIKGDIERLIADINAHPKRDYRTKLFHVMKGVKFASPDLKTELESILNPLAEKYFVTTPAINHIETGDDTLSGKGQPESTITITLPDNKIIKTEVNNDGNWSVKIPKDSFLKHNDVTLIKATGELGTVSNNVAAKVTDTQPPVPPTIKNIEAGSKEITGISEPDSKVSVILPDNQKVESITDKQGNWKVNFDTDLNYGQLVKAEAQDTAGNISVAVSQKVQDTIAPAKPVIQSIEAGTHRISGTSEPESTVIVSLPDGKTVQAQTNMQGIWNVTVQSELEHGNKVTAVAKDAANNLSEKAGQIVKDTKVPAVPVINHIEAGSTRVSGKSEPSSIIELILPNNKTIKVQSNTEGKWNAVLADKLNHNDIVKAVAIDLAGNYSDETLNVVKDTKTPDVPVINHVEAGSKKSHWHKRS